MYSIPKPEHSRPDFRREHWLALNGVWELQLFTDGKGARTYPEIIKGPFSWGAPLSGVRENATGIGWNRHTARFESRGR